MTINFRVEFESTPIRHVAVQCPHCDKWFNGWDIVEGDPLKELRYEHDLGFAVFYCPCCKREFSGTDDVGIDDIQVNEVSYPDVYKNCLKRKETWE